MKNLYITIGCPGAGKSYWSKKQKDKLYVAYDEYHDFDKCFEIINNNTDKTCVFEAMNQNTYEWNKVISNTPNHKHIAVVFIRDNETIMHNLTERDQVWIYNMSCDLNQEVINNEPNIKEFFDEVIYV